MTLLSQENEGAQAHFRGLERLYEAAPINSYFISKLAIKETGRARIEFEVTPDTHHAGGAAHGTIYFKMLDDAAFYAANSMVTDRSLLTTGFNLHFTKPVEEGKIIAEGRWVSGKRRILVAEARLIDEQGDEIGRGTGTFMRSDIALAGLDGYSQAD